MTALPAAQARQFIPAVPAATSPNVLALQRWRDLREDLAAELKGLKPRSDLAVVVQRQLRDATHAVLALEAMK